MSFLTNNAVKMTKMGKEFGKVEKIIICGCSVHLLNLLSQAMEIKNMREHITEIIKYFRNHHISCSLFKATSRIISLDHYIKQQKGECW